MKVALVHEYLIKLGGAEKVLDVLHQIYPQAPVFTLLYDEESTKEKYSDWKIKTSFLQKFPFSIKKYKMYFALMPKAFESFDLTGYDIIISDSHSFAKAVRKANSRTLHICYCHTPTRWLWLNPSTHIKNATFNPITKRLIPKILEKLKKKDKKAALKVDYFVANSKNVAQRIKKIYKRESTVIYPPVDISKFKINQKISNYYIVISRLEPHKKVDIAIKAFNKLKLPLKIVGTGEQEKYLKRIARDNIEFLGEIPDNKLREYLSYAKSLIFPQEEDFGISAVESLASGRPVIAYNKGGAKEIVEQGTSGIFFNKQTPGELIKAIKKFRKIKFRPNLIRSKSYRFSKEIFIKSWLEFIKTAQINFKKGVK